MNIFSSLYFSQHFHMCIRQIKKKKWQRNLKAESLNAKQPRNGGVTVVIATQYISCHTHSNLLRQEYFQSSKELFLTSMGKQCVCLEFKTLRDSQCSLYYLEATVYLKLKSSYKSFKPTVSHTNFLWENAYLGKTFIAFQET